LRSSVNLRAYGQRDPLVEYKKEGLRLFQTMEESYAAHIVRSLPNVLSPAAQNMSAAPRSRFATQVRSITAQRAPTGNKKYGRNDKVTITNGKETQEMKFKKAESLLATGEWRIVAN
jgi:preprotein translocase subunit SecA